MSAQLEAQKADYENSTGRTDFATRFSYGKKAQPVPSDQIDSLLKKYAGG
jgi:hypothetical protein